MKHTDMLEWMNDLNPKYLTEAQPTVQQPQIQMRRMFRRMMPALIAAAVAAVSLTVGVTAYISRNTQMLDSFFGENAEEKVTLAELPEPVVYENDSVRLTVETELDDGIRHALLLSCETLDGVPYDWKDCHMGSDVLRKDGSRAPFSYGGFGFGWDENSTVMQYEDDFPKYWVYYFDCEDIAGETANGESLSFTFAPYDEENHPDNMLEGIRIPLHTEQNVEVAAFETPEGFTYQLSCFELIYTGPCENVEIRKYPQEVTPSSESEQLPSEEEILAYQEKTEEKYLIFNDGTRKKLDPQSSSGWYLRDESGARTDVWRRCDTEFDFVDLDEIAATEIFGEIYPIIR